MKKFFVILILLALLLPVKSIFSAANLIEAMIVDIKGNQITVFLDYGEDDNILFYDLTLSNCPLEEFSTSDFIAIESDHASIPQAGDLIVERVSVSDLLSGSSEYQDCKISKSANKYPDANINMIFTAYLGNMQYAASSMDEQEYLIENQNDCLVNNAGELAILFIDHQSTGQLAQGDDILYAMQVNFELLDFEIVPITNCRIGKVSKVISNDAEFLGMADQPYTVLINDADLGRKMSVKVAPNCALLQADQSFSYGDITYLNGTSNYTTPLFVSFISDSDDLTSLGNLTDLLENNICEVQDFTILEEAVVELYQRPTPYINIELTDYHIGQWGRKVYTNRPKAENMIGAIVKGETDPATYIVDVDGKLRWLKDEAVAKRLFGPDWDDQIIWFNDSIIYTYEFGETIEK